MQERATAPWGLNIGDSDSEKLRAGFEPADQDDKWRVSVKEVGQGGSFSVDFARSATNKELYVVVVKPDDGGTGAKIETITWEQNKGGISISKG